VGGRVADPQIFNVHLTFSRYIEFRSNNTYKTIIVGGRVADPQIFNVHLTFSRYIEFRSRLQSCFFVNKHSEFVKVYL
jgi:hypothetical protein